MLEAAGFHSMWLILLTMGKVPWNLLQGLTPVWQPQSKPITLLHSGNDECSNEKCIRRCWPQLCLVLSPGRRNMVPCQSYTRWGVLLCIVLHNLQASHCDCTYFRMGCNCNCRGCQKRGDVSFFCTVVMALTLFVYINNCKLCVGEISEIHVPNQYSVHVISILFNDT